MPKIKRSELRAHLLRCVQLVKPYLDYMASTYFILAMLFFRYASAVPSFNAALLALPRARRYGYAELLVAFAALEEASPILAGVLLPALANLSAPDSELYEFQENLDQLGQETDVFSSPDRFGVVYEYWIEQLALMTVKRGVAFYTQPSLARLLVELLKPDRNASIYDSTAGTGEMFIEAARYVQAHGGSDRLRFYGREQSPAIWAICRLNMLAHGWWNATIEQGDTLQIAQNAPGTFDLVLQDMPLLPNTRTGLRSEATFVRHALQSLTVDGRAALLTPSSILQHDHHELWQHAVTRDWLEAVISLPPRLLHGTPSSACILLFNRHKPTDRLGHVLFIQAAPDFVPRNRHNHLSDADIERIVQACEHWHDRAGFSRVVSVAHIEVRRYSLNVVRYLAAVDVPESPDIAAALRRYQAAVAEREIAVQQLMKSLHDLDDSSGENPSV